MNKLNIGIILGTTREKRVSPQVGKWVLEQANLRNDANYEIVDIKEFKLPLLGESADLAPELKWQAKLATLDGFIFVVAEYNHSIPASLKNALDSAKAEWINKAAGIVSYGSAFGTRAAEHLRGILAELQVASVRTQVLLSGFTDFENWSVFKPAALHSKNVNAMLDQTIAWSRAFQSLRVPAVR
jgi:NAD(P)H-dependent FMN reductase